MAETKRSIAVFDIDGTLLPGGSAERIFLNHLLRKRELGLAGGFNALRFFLSAWQRDWIAATRGNKHYLRGKSRAKMESLAAICFAREIVPLLSPTGIKVIEERRRAGCEIVLLSGTLDFLIRSFGDHLRADRVHGCELETRGDRFTGNVLGAHPYRQGKTSIIQERYAGTGFDLGASYAYADDASDLDFLSLFGHPFLVNPSRASAMKAGSRGINILRF